MLRIQVVFGSVLPRIENLKMHREGVALWLDGWRLLVVSSY